MNNYMLTTIDNPFNPFNEFDSWLNFDTKKGYNTCGLLARISNSTPNLGPKFEADELDAAMNEIVDVFAPLYFKLGKNDKVSLPIASLSSVLEETVS